MSITREGFPLVAVVGVDGHICEQCSSRLRHPRGTKSVHKVSLAEMRHVVSITCLCRIISAGVCLAAGATEPRKPFIALVAGEYTPPTQLITDTCNSVAGISEAC